MQQIIIDILSAIPNIQHVLQSVVLVNQLEISIGFLRHFPWMTACRHHEQTDSQTPDIIGSGIKRFSLSDFRTLIVSFSDEFGAHRARLLFMFVDNKPFGQSEINEFDLQLDVLLHVAVVAVSSRLALLCAHIDIWLIEHRHIFNTDIVVYDVLTVHEVNGVHHLLEGNANHFHPVCDLQMVLVDEFVRSGYKVEQRSASVLE
mmetsp:Transcript_65667/g.104631  ORF Transcript_65667/g.104631 Transcript_65667/m.104631 type:complete len:203 (+) Transcript_65667:486-1094(+)